ncbi:MAG: DUF4097 family beta strand repeat-containing protein [Gemmatimonadaceae bacterium]
MNRIQLLVAVAFGLALPLGAGAQGRSQIDTTVRIDRQGTVDLSLISGTIRVTGWDRPDVRISAVATGDARLRFDANSNRITLTVDHHGRRGHNNRGDARYDVSVPRGTRLSLEAVSGDVTATGSQGEIDASSVSGDVEVTAGVREVNIESVSGGVRASQVNGNLRAESVSGSVRAETVAGSVDASTVSGTIRLVGIQSRDVRTETVSGDILYTGSIDAGGKYGFESHSGTIRLNIPRTSGAHVSVETFSGNVSTDFTAGYRRPADRGRQGGRYEFTIGDGRARISASSFSGRIVINNQTSETPTRRDDE